MKETILTIKEDKTCRSNLFSLIQIMIGQVLLIVLAFSVDSIFLQLCAFAAMLSFHLGIKTYVKTDVRIKSSLVLAFASLYGKIKCGDTLTNQEKEIFNHLKDQDFIQHIFTEIEFND